MRVNCVMPGFTLTPMVETVPEKVIEILLKYISLRRCGQPEGESTKIMALRPIECDCMCMSEMKRVVEGLMALT